MTLDELVEKESQHVAFGPFWRERELQRSPVEIRDRLKQASYWPEIEAKRVSIDAPISSENPSGSFAAIVNSITERTFFDSPIGTSQLQWFTFPPNDAEPGTVYKLVCGGIISTVNPSPGTITVRARWGAAVTGDLLGTSRLVTPNVGMVNTPWFNEFTLTVRTVGIDANPAGTVTGTGWWRSSDINTSVVNLLYGTNGTVTVNMSNLQGICCTFQWGTANASNSITCQWMTLKKYS